MAVRASVPSSNEHCQVQDSGGGVMPFTFTFTDKEVSIIEDALEYTLDRHAVRQGMGDMQFSMYDIAELSAKITERIAW